MNDEFFLNLMPLPEPPSHSVPNKEATLSKASDVPSRPPRKKANPLLIVLIIVLSLCFLSVSVLCIFLITANRKSELPEHGIPTYMMDEAHDHTIPTETLPTMEPTEVPTTQEPTTEEPTTEAPTTQAPAAYAYLDDLNRAYDNYFDFRPDENGNVIAHSSTQLISRSELYGMSEHEVCIARNEIYARHGYIFQTEKYNAYFKNFSWYVPRTTTLPTLNDIEDQNVKLISSYENEQGW